AARPARPEAAAAVTAMRSDDVIPAKAGIQGPHAPSVALDPRFRGGDEENQQRDATAPSSDIVLDVRELQTHFFLRRGVVKAVDGVSFTLRRGEVLGLVGESGCGKSLTALSLMRLLPKGGARTIHGQVLLNGDDILTRTPRA